MNLCMAPAYQAAATSVHDGSDSSTTFGVSAVCNPAGPGPPVPVKNRGRPVLPDLQPFSLAQFGSRTSRVVPG